MHHRNHERDQARRAADSTDTISLHRSSTSHGLDAPDRPSASGLVAAAADTSGSALPETLMRKFESSLGADLSSVRVHTGAESASAAQAVQAKAYAVGQDIHFGAGQYDPGSANGEHLLAHEVAHTVQQAGGTATRQHKLEVSSPGDALEVEADRAADAMTSGSAFSVTSAGGGLSRSPARIAREPITLPEQRIDSSQPGVIDLDEVQIEGKKGVIQLDEVQIGPQPVIELDEVQIEGTDTGPVNTDKMVENAETAEKKSKERSSADGGVIGDVGAIVVQDKADAGKIIAMINGDSGKLETGIANGDVKPFVRGANADAVNTLGAYGEVLEGDSFNNDAFQQQAKLLAADFARLKAQMGTLDKSGQSSGAQSEAAKGPAGAARGARMGDSVVDSASGQSAATLNKDFKKTVTAGDKEQGHSTNATEHWKNAQDREKEMNDAEAKVAETSRSLMPKQSAALAAAANVKAMAAGAEAAAHQGEIDKIKTDAAAAEEKIKLVGGTVKNIASIAFAATDPKGPNVGAIVGAALDTVTNLVAYTAKHFDDGDIEKEEEKKKVAKTNEIFHRSNEAAKTALKTVQELQNTAVAYVESITAMSTAKTRYRDAMKLMGNALDKAQGGNAFSVTAQVLSEAEAYLVQAKLAIESGRNTVGKLPADKGGPRQAAGTTGSVVYYLGVAPPDGHTYFATRGSFTMKGSLTGKGENVLGDALTKEIERIEGQRDEIEGLAKSLRGVFKP